MAMNHKTNCNLWMKHDKFLIKGKKHTKVCCKLLKLPAAELRLRSLSTFKMGNIGLEL